MLCGSGGGNPRIPARKNSFNRGPEHISTAFIGLAPKKDLLRQQVLAQLDSLALPHQMILKTASAIGPSFDRSVLVHTYPGSAAEVDEALTTSLAAYVVRHEASAPARSARGIAQRATFDQQGSTEHDVQYFFRSRHTAAIIYDLMLTTQRTRIHAQVAAWCVGLGDRSHRHTLL